jgi:hypothetical protein
MEEIFKKFNDLMLTMEDYQEEYPIKDIISKLYAIQDEIMEVDSLGS